MKVFDTYFGGKNGSGVYQQIINCIRPHDVYMELFVGGGAVFRNKKRAAVNVINDIDPDVCKKWLETGENWFRVYNSEAVIMLNSFKFDRNKKYVIYLDPPYPIYSRRSAKAVYNYEMDDAGHYELLRCIAKLPKNVDVLISTYENDIYSELLKGWRLLRFNAKTRSGVATECLYMNYSNEAGLLHDYGYLGVDFIDRQRIKRKIEREIARLNKLPAVERNAIVAAIQENTAGIVVSGCASVQLELSVLPAV